MFDSMRKTMKFLRKFQFNSPVILTYAIISLVALLISILTGGASNRLLFSAYRASPGNPLTYLRVVFHIFGHADFSHLLSNFLVILLVGPMLEEKYGTAKMIIMILITSVATGGVFLLISSDSALLGASGVAFMMILLSSFVNLQKGRIPITVILVIVAYIGREAVSGLTTSDNISQVTHVIGGLCGAFMGFIFNRYKELDAPIKEAKPEIATPKLEV
jgi:membrane associated rhomboid family serine protease